jgi:hypothetical protein
MNDVDFTRAFERGEIRPQDFHHRSHLRVAWVYLRESNALEQAAAKMRAAIRQFASAAGHPEKYHETITVFWVRLLGALPHSFRQNELEHVLQVNPELLEKDLPLEYYSRETLFSDRARTSWVDPDLRSLTTHATPIHSSHSASDPSHRVVCR